VNAHQYYAIRTLPVLLKFYCPKYFLYTSDRENRSGGSKAILITKRTGLVEARPF
jgi:hypothetical protein